MTPAQLAAVIAAAYEDAAVRMDAFSGDESDQGFVASMRRTAYAHAANSIRARAAEVAANPALIGMTGQTPPNPTTTGRVFVMSGATLRVNNDGHGSLFVAEDDFQLEDDRGEGPDGPEGSVHWTTRIDATEMLELRAFLNRRFGPTIPDPAPWEPPPEAEREDGFPCMVYDSAYLCWFHAAWGAATGEWFRKDDGQPVFHVTAFHPLPPTQVTL